MVPFFSGWNRGDLWNVKLHVAVDFGAEEQRFQVKFRNYTNEPESSSGTGDSSESSESDSSEDSERDEEIVFYLLISLHVETHEVKYQIINLPLWMRILKISADRLYLRYHGGVTGLPEILRCPKPASIEA